MTLGGTHDFLMKKTLKTTKVRTKKETIGSSSQPWFRVGEKIRYLLAVYLLFSFIARLSQGNLTS